VYVSILESVGACGIFTERKQEIALNASIVLFTQKAAGRREIRSNEGILPRPLFSFEREIAR